MNERQKVINKPYSPEIIDFIIAEYEILKNQFIIITPEQIFEEISELLNDRLMNNSN
jgi:hypothetical protein